MQCAKIVEATSSALSSLSKKWLNRRIDILGMSVALFLLCQCQLFDLVLDSGT